MLLSGIRWHTYGMMVPHFGGALVFRTQIHPYDLLTAKPVLCILCTADFLPTEHEYPIGRPVLSKGSLFLVYHTCITMSGARTWAYGGLAVHSVTTEKQFKYKPFTCSFMAQSFTPPNGTTSVSFLSSEGESSIWITVPHNSPNVWTDSYQILCKHLWGKLVKFLTHVDPWQNNLFHHSLSLFRDMHWYWGYTYARVNNLSLHWFRAPPSVQLCLHTGR